jgi:dihydroorotate dehydrogenase
VIDSVKAVKVVSRHPIIVKVSADQDFIAIARGVKGFAEAISLNSVPWKKVFGEKRSPLWRLDKKFGGGGGGVSGKPAQKENWEAVRKLVEDSSLPVICPSVMDSGDVTRALELNPGAISFGAIHILTPCRPTAIVEREEMYARLHNNAKVV